jgi:hypothetical protein
MKFVKNIDVVAQSFYMPWAPKTPFGYWSIISLSALFLLCACDHELFPYKVIIYA